MCTLNNDLWIETLSKRINKGMFWKKTYFVSVGWTNRKLIDTCWLQIVESVKMSREVHFSKRIILVLTTSTKSLSVLSTNCCFDGSFSLHLATELSQNCNVPAKKTSLSFIVICLFMCILVHILLIIKCILTENPSPSLFIVVCPYLRPLLNAHMLDKLYVQNLHPYYWKCISRWPS